MDLPFHLSLTSKEMFSHETLPIFTIVVFNTPVGFDYEHKRIRAIEGRFFPFQLLA